MDEEVVLDLNQIRAVRVLGRGAMASVFLVSAAPGSRLPTLFALKVFDKQSAAKPHALRRARWELSLLSRLSAAPGDHHHPFLPSLLGSVETPDLLAWAIPFCPGGDLHALRRSLSPSNEEAFSADAIRFYLSEIVTALAHLHSMRVAYRDLKPENVLLRSSGHIMLADFDLSRHLPARSTTHSSLPPPLPSDNHSHAPRRKLTRVFSFGAADDQIKKGRSARVSPASRRRTSSSSISKSREGSGGDDERSFSFVGTEEYVAPEVVRGEGHGFAVDWWALGILAYEMAYGQTPFRGRNRKETLRNILTLPPMFPGRRRTDLTDIIERLVVKDPERRLGFSGGAEEVKAHPFFDGVKWELLPEVARPPGHIASQCPNKRSMLLKENGDIETESESEDDNVLPPLLKSDVEEYVVEGLVRVMEEGLIRLPSCRLYSNNFECMNVVFNEIRDRLDRHEDRLEQLQQEPLPRHRRPDQWPYFAPNVPDDDYDDGASNEVISNATWRRARAIRPERPRHVQRKHREREAAMELQSMPCRMINFIQVDPKMGQSAAEEWNIMMQHVPSQIPY
ncbi:hypothetical protein ZIOFF_050785 [Zingiber officinale]|uniref:non-specific serine/threonine protein kinase n=1 Tax=Zingiber officinale TaxID=94328 RepID=A0A8J5KRJ8_ZINOF|nr:hypothetical protein ZIOFF_050785 [Zingiber officinale]